MIYATATSGEVQVDNDEWLFTLDEDAAVNMLYQRFEDVLDYLDADDAILAITDSFNWRTFIFPQYKANRKTLRRPAYLPKLRERVMLEERGCFRPMKVRHLEADDVCGIASGYLRQAGKEPIIVSQDKDLWSIPGLVWNPRPDKRGKYRHIEEVSEVEADKWHLIQALAGDPIDNYKGCPGVGITKATALVDRFEKGEEVERWKAIEGKFLEKGLTKKECLTQAQIARILRWTDWDAPRRKVKLWEPPR